MKAARRQLRTNLKGRTTEGQISAMIRCASVLLTLQISYCALAQEVHTLSLPMLVEPSVFITNRGRLDIAFSIRPSSGVWSTHTVVSGGSSTISCDQCSTESFEISINTEGEKTVSYRLDSGKRYEIQWNSEKELWDIFAVRK